MKPALAARTRPILRLVALTSLVMLAGATPAAEPPGDQGPHPLIHEWQRETFNLWAELKTSLGQRAFGEAAQLIFQASAEARQGLVADLKDPQILLPYQTFLAVVLDDWPQVREAIQRQFGKLAPMRAKAAVAEGDLDALQTLVVQFQGTEQSAEVLRWLGDRALGAGRFEEAMAHYRRAWPVTGTAPPALAARFRLTGALLGQRLGQPVDSPVAWGKSRWSAAEFERLIAELLTKRAPAPADIGSGGMVYDEIAPAPAPGPLSAQLWPSANDFRRPTTRPRDGAGLDGLSGNVCAVATRRALVVGDGRRLAAFDLASREKTWGRDVIEQPSYAQYWRHVPLRPLAAGDRVFLRRWTEKGLQLSCLDLADGKPVWTHQSELYPVTDPLWSNSRVIVLMAALEEMAALRKSWRVPPHFQWRVRPKHATPWVLQWTALEPATGNVLDQEPLVRLRYRGGIPLCRADAEGRWLVVSFPGGLLAIDRCGGLRWVRRRPWQAATPDRPLPSLTAAIPDPPLLAGDRVLLLRSGSGIESFDLATGRLQWDCQAPGVTRWVGTVAHRAIALDGAGLVAIDVASGRIAWRHAVEGPNLLFCGGPGQLAYSTWQEDLVGQRLPALVWIDPATGKTVGRHVLDGVAVNRHTSKSLPVGPALVADGRLLAFYRETSRGQHGLGVLELSPSGLPQGESGRLLGAPIAESR